jgi:hypothetical protein
MAAKRKSKKPLSDLAHATKEVKSQLQYTLKRKEGYVALRVDAPGYKSSLPDARWPTVFKSLHEAVDSVKHWRRSGPLSAIGRDDRVIIVLTDGDSSVVVLDSKTDPGNYTRSPKKRASRSVKKPLSDMTLSALQLAALRAFPSSPKQLEIRKEIEKRLASGEKTWLPPLKSPKKRSSKKGIWASVKKVFSGSPTKTSRYGGWPLTPSKRFPKETALECPKCGSQNITLTGHGTGRGTGPGGRHRLGDPSVSYALCESCGAKGYLSEGSPKRKRVKRR